MRWAMPNAKLSHKWWYETRLTLVSCSGLFFWCDENLTKFQNYLSSVLSLTWELYEWTPMGYVCNSNLFFNAQVTRFMDEQNVKQSVKNQSFHLHVNMSHKAYAAGDHVKNDRLKKNKNDWRFSVVCSWRKSQFCFLLLFQAENFSHFPCAFLKLLRHNRPGLLGLKR